MHLDICLKSQNVFIILNEGVLNYSICPKISIVFASRKTTLIKYALKILIFMVQN
jgi:hypothetical protein